MEDSRLLIITADDFGFSKERNGGIIKALHKNAVRSASVLMNCTGTEETASLIENNDICVGLHLNLTEGRPVGKENYKTLVNDDGTFRGKHGLRCDLKTNKICQHEIRQEIESQIEKFTQVFGTKPIYVDGHQHIHVHPGIAQIFAEVVSTYRINITRYPVEFDIVSNNWIDSQRMAFYLELMENAEGAKNIFDCYGVKSADSFVGLSTMGSDMTTCRLQTAILKAFQTTERNQNKLRPATCELMTHPGYPTDRKMGGFSWGTDDFGASEDRLHEIDVLACTEMIDFYKANNIQVVSHKVLL